MSSDWNSAELCRELADTVVDELSADLPRVSAHLGENYAEADEPEARSIRNHGGTFLWVAFGFKPYSMWNAHVGVLTADDRVVVGLHVHERVSVGKPAAVAAIAGEIGAEYRYSDAADEHQFNRPPIPLERVDVEDLSQDIADLCRRLNPVVNEVVS
jgi:hypothetical protein